MRKITFLEGLPGVGKTTIVNILKENYNLLICNEIENSKIIDKINDDQSLYMKNDEIKINKYQQGNIVIDRGLISTMAYNIAKKQIDKTYNNEKVLNWFEKNKDIYNQDFVSVIYLKRKDYKIPYNDIYDPYGSLNNQKLLEEVTIDLCNKYVRKLKIINYQYETDLEMIINEIIN